MERRGGYAPSLLAKQSRGKDAEIHSRRDTLNPLDPQKFIDTVEFMAKFSDAVVNAIYDQTSLVTSAINGVLAAIIAGEGVYTDLFDHQYQK